MTATPDVTWWRSVSESLTAAAEAEAEPERALRVLQNGLRSDATLVCAVGTGSDAKHHIVANTGYPETVLRYLTEDYPRECPGYAYVRQQNVAVRIRDNFESFRVMRTFTEVLHPAGFREGVTVPFFSPWGEYGGFLAMSATDPDAIDDEAIFGLTLLRSCIAGLAFPRALERPLAGDERVVAEIHATSLRWVRRGNGDIPMTEGDIHDFVSRMQSAGRTRAGFYLMATDRRWWHVSAVTQHQANTYVSMTPRAPHGCLTPREIDVLTLVCQGRTNGEIADELFISLRTVKSHVEALLRKLEQSNRTGLVAIASAEDLVGPKFLH